MVELERRGIPTVIFTATAFVHDARSSAQSFGLAGLTRPVEAFTGTDRPPIDERLVYEGADLLDAWDRMNRDFLARGWSDGFPLVAPTDRAVDAMLAGTARDRGEIIATLEPGFGIATVEKLAISAVMAGCGPSTCRSSSPR